MFLLFDIGGTNTRMAVSRDGENFEKPVIFPTPVGFDEGISLFKERALELTNENMSGIVGGLPGILNKDKSSLLDAPNLKDWNGKPIKSELEKEFGAPAYLENDAALAALGEAVYGAGKGKRIVAYLTISTGVGGARAVSGKIDENVFGFEPGRQLMDGIHDLEYFCSGNSFKKRYGKEPEEISDPAIWEETTLWLARGIHNLTDFWSPDIIVLGGSVMLNRISIDQLRLSLEKINKEHNSFLDLPELVLASLGDESGLYGGLARAKFLDNNL